MSLARKSPDFFQQAPWDREDLQRAAQLWAAGQSAAQIARQLNRSRNAVIGKIHRNRDHFPRRAEVSAPAEAAADPSAVGTRPQPPSDALPDCSFEEAWNRPWSEAEKIKVAAMVRARMAPSGIGVRIGRTGAAVNALMKREPGRFREVAAQPPLCPAGHLPHAGGRQEASASLPGSRLEAPVDWPVKASKLSEVAADPGVPPRGAAAFAPLPGTRPVSHLERTGCTWAVDPEGHSGPQLFCDAPVSPARRDSAKPCWCATHVRFERLRAGYVA